MSATASDHAPDLAGQRAAMLTHLLRGEGELDACEEVVEVVQLEGGWSRLSFAATARLAGGAQRRYIVRVKAPVALFDTDLLAEYAVFVALEDVDLPTPRAFGLVGDEDNPFGGQLFVMEHLRGHPPNVWRPKDNEALRADWDGGRGIATDAVTALARIHGIGGELAPEGLPTVAFEEHVARWRRAYEDAALIRDPVVEEALDWLDHHAPSPVPVRLVHGDYRAGNFLVEDGRITGILDWELATMGDPRFDLGYFVLPYIAGKHLRPKTDLAAGLADRAWFLAEYERLTGTSVDPEAVRAHSVLGALSLIAMTHIGARRYADGRTTDVRRVWARFLLPGLREDLTRLLEF